MVETSKRPLLVIPGEPDTLSDFIARLISLITSTKTHLYVDASMLMWLTKIGSGSRQELFSWLEKNCLTRVHVPIWAAHEYLKHHVAGTIVAELAQKTSEVAAIASRTYSFFRPFIDEPLEGGAQDAATVRASTRSALHELQRLTEASRKWQKSYQKHSKEVIAFINKYSIEQTSIYDDLRDIGQLGANRFMGSIPPGFQDAHKKGKRRNSSDSDEETRAGSNRYGDLLFWKEVLVHAKQADAQALILLTNDRKNDWHMGGLTAGRVDASLLAIKRNWKPIPRPHPMLAMEARLVADVEQVELLDGPYLATILRECAESEVRLFADVAIVPEDGEAESEKARRNRLIDERVVANGRTGKATEDPPLCLFPDPPDVVANRGGLLKGLLYSREPADELSIALLDTWRTNVAASISLSESISAKTFDGFDHKALVRLARELHDRVLTETPGYGESLTDVLLILDRLPPNTAASLYLGLLSSMYLNRADNTSRIPPRSPIAQLLFERQSADYAVVAVELVEKRLKDNEFRPVYIPNVGKPSILVTFDTESETHAIDQLQSLRLGEVELLTAAQADDALRLHALFAESDAVSGEIIVLRACELFGLPVKQLERTAVFGTNFTITKTIGFKRPGDILIPKEDLVDG